MGVSLEDQHKAVDAFMARVAMSFPGTQWYDTKHGEHPTTLPGGSSLSWRPTTSNEHWQTLVVGGIIAFTAIWRGESKLPGLYLQGRGFNVALVGEANPAKLQILYTRIEDYVKEEGG